MIARLLIILLLIGLSAGAYNLLKMAHMRRLNRTPGKRTRPSLIFFSSEACEACPTQARYISRLPGSVFEGLDFRKIDAQAEPDIAGQYGVFTLPTTVIVDRSGTVKDVNYGLIHADRLRRQLEQVI